MSLLRYLFDHNQQVIGGLMVIILATAALLALRMVQQEKSAPAGGASHVKGAVVDIDLGAIEAAFKRVMAAQSGAPVSAGAAAAAAPTGDGSSESKIQELAREIDRLTAELSSKSDGGGFGGTGAATSASAAGSSDSGALEALNAKISELEGKLTEYEIIEDDIADLSRFKEENAELRGEIEALKARTLAATGDPTISNFGGAGSPAPAASSAATESDSSDDALSALEAELAAAPMAPKIDEEAISAKAELDEATLKEFASSVEVQKPDVASADVAASSDLNFAVAAASMADGSSVLDASVDTEKMLSEVSTLAESTEQADDVMAGELDTEKLLAEVNSLTPQAAPTAPAAAVSQDPEAKFEDDLLAEFKDSNDRGQG